MKIKILLSVLMCVVCISMADAQVAGPVADENVELMSVLARLADYPEYNKTEEPYASVLDSCFNVFRNHPTEIWEGGVRVPDDDGEMAI